MNRHMAIVFTLTNVEALRVARVDMLAGRDGKALNLFMSLRPSRMVLL